MTLDMTVSKKQIEFMKSEADETLFGGAARWRKVRRATTGCREICS